MHKPPMDKDAEMSVLGAVFLDQDSINTILGIISIDDFYIEAHRKIFQTLVNLTDNNKPCDFVTVNDELTRSGSIKEVGGISYIIELTDYVPTSANVAFYCNIVKDRSMNRRMIAIGAELSNLGYAQEAGASELLEAALSKLMVQERNGPTGSAVLVVDAVRRLKKRYESKGVIQGIPYGFSDLDSATCGMHRGELIIVAGRPSMGKSAFACNVLENICATGYTGMLFSLEMEKGSIVDRMLASRGGIRYGNIRSGNIADSEWSRNARACDEITRFNFTVDDTPAISLREVKSKARKQKRKGLDVVFIDYLQLMSVNPRDNRVQAIGEISRGLKQLARELDCVVVLLSQLSRAVDSRPDKRPMMNDLRDSGEIEQDADVILFPYRPAAYCLQCKDRVDNDQHRLNEHQSMSELIVEKQRNGERNLSIKMVWHGDFQRFEGIT